MEKILREIQTVVKDVDIFEQDKLVLGLLSARRIFVAGAGRSGLACKGFAMRLKQAGLEVYVAGETITPEIGKDDLLFIASGTGKTATLNVIADNAKKQGARLALITTAPNSPLGQQANLILRLNANSKADTCSGRSIQPMATLFEQSLWLVLDDTILHLMEQSGQTSEEMFARHANLE